MLQWMSPSIREKEMINIKTRFLDLLIHRHWGIYIMFLILWKSTVTSHVIKWFSLFFYKLQICGAELHMQMMDFMFM